MYDLIVIGGGPGGFGAAVRAAQLGMTALLFECGDIGGTCLNRGCIPTKTLMHSASVFEQIKTAAEFGIDTKPATVDFQKLRERKNEVSDKLRSGMESLLAANKVDIIRAKAQITAPGMVSAGGEQYESKNILIATGSKPARPPIRGLEHALTSDELLGSLPDCKSLIIIGGGVIGVELGSIYASLGCEVTIIEALDRILFNLDREISQNLGMILKKRGVSVHAGASVSEIFRSDSGVSVRFEKKDETTTVSAEAVLAATGRSADTEGLFIMDEPEKNRGCLVVAESYMTTIPGIYAIGDVIGGLQLAHKAEYEGAAAVEIIAGHKAGVNALVVPSCVYTDPEIAAVGITADEAKALGIEVKTGKYVMGGNAKTVIDDSERGFIKLVCDAASGKILGAQMMCGRATDMISEFVTAIVNGLTIDQMALSMRPHPSFSEGISEALGAALGRAIHVMPPKKK